VAHVITFRSARFDLSQERPNPINPIAGETVLRWLAQKLTARSCRVTRPEPEDWGWYIHVVADRGSYLVGASGEPEERGTTAEWTIQIERHRSLKDKLTGRNKLAADDPLSALIERVLRDEAGADNVDVFREA